jgi:hypothetical protein
MVSVVTLLSACSPISTTDPTTGATLPPGEETISVLFSLTADAGTLAPLNGSSTEFILTLTSTDAHTIWFSDRPSHTSGTIATSAFVSDWAYFGFAAEPPNVAIVLHDAANETDTLVAEVTNPTFDDLTDTFSASVTVHDEATSTGDVSTFEHFGSEGDPSLPASFSGVSIFINDVAGAVKNGCIVAPHLVC